MITAITNVLVKYYNQEDIPITVTENDDRTKMQNSFVYDIVISGKVIHTFELAVMVDAYRHEPLSEAAIAAEIINCLIDTIENALSR